MKPSLSTLLTDFLVPNYRLKLRTSWTNRFGEVTLDLGRSNSFSVSMYSSYCSCTVSFSTFSFIWASFLTIVPSFDKLIASLITRPFSWLLRSCNDLSNWRRSRFRDSGCGCSLKVLLCLPLKFLCSLRTRAALFVSYFRSSRAFSYPFPVDFSSCALRRFRNCFTAGKLFLSVFVDWECEMFLVLLFTFLCQNRSDAIITSFYFTSERSWMFMWSLPDDS